MLIKSDKKFFGINKMNNVACLYIAMSTCFGLLGCQNNQEKKVVALRDVNMYREVGALYSQPDFIIPKGSICFLGEEVYDKVDKFRKIRCENGLNGWVVDEDYFQ